MKALRADFNNLKKSAIVIYTVGHSTLQAEELAAILEAHRIECVADVRSYPGSRKFPQFNRETLAGFLDGHKIEYVWLNSLGGRRGASQKPSPNTGLRNASFRNYADYMLTSEFAEGIQQLLQKAAQKPTAVMCAEKLFFRCHRRLISDYLTAQGVEVVHIYDEKRVQKHTLSEIASVTTDGKLVYTEPRQENDGLFVDTRD
jgi:uncharacterized protein (DUF488 family)